MTSNKANAGTVPEDDSELTFGPDAVKMVVDGYTAIANLLEGAQNRGLFPKGLILKEMIHKHHSVPPLLTAMEFVAFRDATNLQVHDDAVVAIWHILRNDCIERRLRPVLSIEEIDYRLEVILI